jgi:hypothetical protein
VKGFEERRKTFNGICTAKPAIIVAPTTPAQISAILVAARQNKVEIRQGQKMKVCIEHRWAKTLKNISAISIKPLLPILYYMYT